MTVSKCGDALLRILFKERIADLLLPVHKLLVPLEAIGLALDIDNGAVVQDVIQDG